jgi:cell division transport system permease protein
MIGGLGYFVSEAWLSLWRGRGASVLSVLTIAIAAFVLGLVLLVGSHVQATVNRWSRSAEVSVYLRDDATAGQRTDIERALRTDKSVAGLDVVSKDQALARFRRDFPDLAPATTTIAPDNPFPASFEVRFGPAPPGGPAVERLAARVAALPGVADVRYDRRWLDRLASLGQFVRWAGLGLAAVLLLAAALTVTNVVRLSLHARRDEIEIMELVGAPLAFIRGPFICEGMLQGGLGAVLALVALRAGVALAAPRLSAMAAGLFDVGRIEFLSGAAVAGLIVGAMAVGCLGGLVASRRAFPIGTNFTR